MSDQVKDKDQEKDKSEIKPTPKAMANGIHKEYGTFNGAVRRDHY